MGGSVRFIELFAYFRRRNNKADAPITPRAIVLGSGVAVYSKLKSIKSAGSGVVEVTG
jgi:hypothetical protein